MSVTSPNATTINKASGASVDVCMQPHRHLPDTLCTWEDVAAAVASVQYASDEDLAIRREQFLHSALVLACLSEAAQHLVHDDVASAQRELEGLYERTERLCHFDVSFDAEPSRVWQRTNELALGALDAAEQLDAGNHARAVEMLIRLRCCALDAALPPIA
jgi:hypothetical protein